MQKAGRRDLEGRPRAPGRLVHLLRTVIDGQGRRGTCPRHPRPRLLGWSQRRGQAPPLPVPQQSVSYNSKFKSCGFFLFSMKRLKENSVPTE